LQSRRRLRQRQSLVTVPALEDGLVQFYQPAAGLPYVRSWNESAGVPPDPLAGMVQPVEGTPGESGGYSEGDVLVYYLFPLQVSESGSLYTGVLRWVQCDIVTDLAPVDWPAWTTSPQWVTDCLIIAIHNGQLYGWRVVSMATMENGWTDDGTGWAPGLPHEFLIPPVTAKVLWNCNGAFGSAPGNIPVVMSPFGGDAFDASAGANLTRLLSDDLRRLVDCTLAYWVCPLGSGGVLATVRGIYGANLGGDFADSAGSLIFGDTYYWLATVTATDDIEGDWYLAVVRCDSLNDAFKLDLWRLRGETHYTYVGALSTGAPVNVLDANSDYWLEGLLGVLSVGGSFHWGSPGYGYYDRIGLWNRALTDEEVGNLYNSGLGWAPGN
jgi:hypothetical protein